MPFERRILHHGPSPTGIPQLLSNDAIRSAWFELHRQGGCGAGEVQLADTFNRRDRVEVGDWISFESEANARWYLGRVEERRAEVPAGVRLRLEGMAIELNEIFPGGFGSQADGQRPHRYAATDLFSHDPDRSIETRDDVESVEEVVRLILQQYVVSASNIEYNASRVESPSHPATVESLKFRGEESVRSILKELAVRAQSASWGVDQFGQFFFLRPRTTILEQFQERKDLIALAESRDYEFLFNRVLLTGDYVYDRQDVSEGIARRSYRWRGNFIQRASQQSYGDRRIRVWLPWIRTQQDSMAFAKEFFRTYSQPGSRYFIETAPLSSLSAPWDGQVRVLDAEGEELITARMETVRVLFDHALRVRMELGPDDPKNLWPEPPQDERWELPDDLPSAGGDITMPPSLPSVDPPPGTSSDGVISSSDATTSLQSSGMTSSGLSSSAPTSSLLSSSLVSSTGRSNSVDSSERSSSSGVSSSNESDSAASSSGQPSSEEPSANSQSSEFASSQSSGSDQSSGLSSDHATSSGTVSSGQSSDSNSSNSSDVGSSSDGSSQLDSSDPASSGSDLQSSDGGQTSSSPFSSSAGNNSSSPQSSGGGTSADTSDGTTSGTQSSGGATSVDTSDGSSVFTSSNGQSFGFTTSSDV